MQTWPAITTGATYRFRVDPINAQTGEALDLTSASIWVALKVDVDDADASAAIFINSDDDSEQFTLTSSQISVYFSPAQTEELDPGAEYFLIVKAKRSEVDIDFLVDSVKIPARRGGIEAS